MKPEDKPSQVVELNVVSVLPVNHKAHCAVYDPTPSRCDCRPNLRAKVEVSELKRALPAQPAGAQGEPVAWRVAHGNGFFSEFTTGKPTDIAIAHWTRMGAIIEYAYPKQAVAQGEQFKITQNARVDSSIMSRAMEHPTVLEIMAACAQIIETESSAVVGPEYDGSALRATAKRYLEQAAKIRESEPDIWEDCPIAGLTNKPPAAAPAQQEPVAYMPYDVYGNPGKPISKKDYDSGDTGAGQFGEYWGGTDPLYPEAPAAAINEQMLEAFKTLWRDSEWRSRHKGSVDPDFVLKTIGDAIAAAEEQIKEQSK